MSRLIINSDFGFIKTFSLRQYGETYFCSLRTLLYDDFNIITINKTKGKTFCDYSNICSFLSSGPNLSITCFSFSQQEYLWKGLSMVPVLWLRQKWKATTRLKCQGHPSFSLLQDPPCCTSVFTIPPNSK